MDKATKAVYRVMAVKAASLTEALAILTAAINAELKIRELTGGVSIGTMPAQTFKDGTSQPPMFYAAQAYLE